MTHTGGVADSWGKNGGRNEGSGKVSGETCGQWTWQPSICGKPHGGFWGTISGCIFGAHVVSKFDKIDSIKWGYLFKCGPTAIGDIFFFTEQNGIQAFWGWYRPNMGGCRQNHGSIRMEKGFFLASWFCPTLFSVKPKRIPSFMYNFKDPTQSVAGSVHLAPTFSGNAITINSINIFGIYGKWVHYTSISWPKGLERRLCQCGQTIIKCTHLWPFINDSVNNMKICWDLSRKALWFANVKNVTVQQQSGF